MSETKDDGSGTPEEDQGERTYTEAEHKAEIDRRVTMAVKKVNESAEIKTQEGIEAAKLEAKTEKLKEQGEFKTLHEQKTAELDALKATLATKDERDAIGSALKEAKLGDFEDALMGVRSKPEDYVKAGEALQARVKELVDAEVAIRLDTGKKPDGSPSDTPKSQQEQLNEVYPGMAATG